MYVDLPYGNNSQNFDTDDFEPPLKIGGRFKCRFPPALDSSSISAKILNGLKNLSHLFDNKKVLTIVNDGYRRTPTSSVLPAIWPYLKNSDFIVATGSHRRSSKAELRLIFGDFFDKVESRLQFHDCYKNEFLESLGVTSRNTPVSINRAVLEADLVLTINSVEPHFFAGFTGGRKSLIPGLAGFDTIQANHRLAKDMDSCALSLETNPLHLDLEESTQLLNDKPVLTIQCVTDREGKIIDLYSGDLRMAFYQACESAKSIYSIEVPRKYDIVVANCEPPLDSNLYQLQKAQDHGGRMVRDGGVLIVMGACLEGTGSPYFMELAGKYPDPKMVLDLGMLDDSFGIHKLIKTARQLQKFQIFYVTTLDDREVRRVYFKSFEDVTVALKSAAEILGSDQEIGILEDAGYSVPVIKT